MKSIKKLFPVIVAIVAVLLSGCSKQNQPLELQPMALEDLDPRTQWVVVTDPYVACRKDPSYEKDVVESLRKGEIYKIEGVCTVAADEKMESSEEIWYALEKGWVPASSVKIFSNKLRAEEFKKNRS